MPPVILDSRGRKFLEVEDLEGVAKWQWEFHILKNFQESLQGCVDLRLDVRNIRKLIEEQKIQAKRRFSDNPDQVQAMIFGYELFSIVIEKCTKKNYEEPPITMAERIKDLKTYINLDTRFDEICASFMSAPLSKKYHNVQDMFKFLYQMEQVLGKIDSKNREYNNMIPIRPIHSRDQL